jgi:hypothetical protein
MMIATVGGGMSGCVWVVIGGSVGGGWIPGGVVEVDMGVVVEPEVVEGATFVDFPVLPFWSWS